MCPADGSEQPGAKPLQPDLSYDDLRAQAQATNPVFQQQMNGAVDAMARDDPGLFAGVEFSPADIKSDESASDKMDRKYSHSENPQRHLQDLVRGSIYADTPEQIEAIRQYIAENFDVVDTDNRFANPSETGFRDINMKIRMDNGHIVELQLHHRGMMEANQATHDLFEEKRELDRIAENRELTDAEVVRRREIVQELRDVHGRAAAQAGLDNMLDPSERSTFSRAADVLGDIGRSNRNVIVDVGIGVAVGAAALATGSTPAEAAEATVDVLNPIPATTDAVLSGDSAGDVAVAVVQDVSVLGGCAAGAAAGVQGGAALGGLAGTAVPVVGNAAGAVGGGIIGGIGGCVAGAWIAGGFTDAVIDFFRGDEKSASLDEIRNILPDTVTPDMPPEFAALVEVQNSDELLQKAIDDLKGQGSFEGMVQELERQSDLYQQAQQQQPHLAEQPAAPMQHESPLPPQRTSNFG